MLTHKRNDPEAFVADFVADFFARLIVAGCLLA